MHSKQGVKYCTVQVLCTTVNKTIKTAQPLKTNKRTAGYCKVYYTNLFILIKKPLNIKGVYRGGKGG